LDKKINNKHLCNKN